MQCHFPDISKLFKGIWTHALKLDLEFNLNWFPVNIFRRVSGVSTGKPFIPLYRYTVIPLRTVNKQIEISHPVGYSAGTHYQDSLAKTKQNKQFFFMIFVN